MVRLTPTVAEVLTIMLTRGGEHYGRGLGEATMIAPGTLHAILTRLERAGVLVSRYEAVIGRGVGARAPRRYYQFTADGAAFAATALAKTTRAAHSSR
jgi:PadR family transcriptional regulator PadR